MREAWILHARWINPEHYKAIYVDDNIAGGAMIEDAKWMKEITLAISVTQGLSSANGNLTSKTWRYFHRFKWPTENIC